MNVRPLEEEERSLRCAARRAIIRRERKSRAASVGMTKEGRGFGGEIDGLLAGSRGVESGASQQPCSTGKGRSSGFGTSSNHDAKLHRVSRLPHTESGNGNAVFALRDTDYGNCTNPSEPKSTVRSDCATKRRHACRPCRATGCNVSGSRERWRPDRSFGGANGAPLMMTGCRAV
jgi:hypothetical protein